MNNVSEGLQLPTKEVSIPEKSSESESLSETQLSRVDMVVEVSNDLDNLNHLKLPLRELQRSRNCARRAPTLLNTVAMKLREGS